MEVATTSFKKHRSQLTKIERAAAIAQAAVNSEQQQLQGPIPAVLPVKQKPLTGVLQRVPVVSPPDEQLNSALKRAGRVVPSSTIKNEAEKERNRAARQLDTLMKELSVPLTKYMSGFPKPGSLQAFEQVLLDLTVGAGAYVSVLGKVDSLRKALQETGKSYANRATKAPSKRAATAVAEEGCAALEQLFTKGSKIIIDLKGMGKQLRGLPYVDPGVPTMALVGAPNVGKSSLVKVMSSGTPEVCNYPFTTRSIKMGHFYVHEKKHQVTDTPGLLARPDEYRNKMEMLTLAALDHLPSSVMFVFDLTEECGTSVWEQWVIRQELRGRYPDKPWVDVFSKADLLGSVLGSAQQQQHYQQQQSQQERRRRREEGTHQQEQQLQGAQQQQEEQHGSKAQGDGASSDNLLRTGGAWVEQGTRSSPELISSSSSSCVEMDVWAGSGNVQDPPGDAAAVAAALPGAVRVSSLTEEGLDALKVALMRMLD